MENNMPTKPPKPCRFPGCPELVDNGYCEEHADKINGRYEQERGTATARGYGTRWQKLRDRFAKKFPLCAECLRNGHVTPMKDVHHKIKHDGDVDLLYDWDNLESLCRACHNAKTAKGE